MVNATPALNTALTAAFQRKGAIFMFLVSFQLMQLVSEMPEIIKIR